MKSQEHHLDMDISLTNTMKSAHNALSVTAHV